MGLSPLYEPLAEVSLYCEGSSLYTGSNPLLTDRLPLPPHSGDRRVIADVTPHSQVRA